MSIIAGTLVVGALAWLVARSSLRRPAAYAGPVNWPAAEAARARHPAGRDRRACRGPDDDPDFLRALDAIIRGA